MPRNHTICMKWSNLLGRMDWDSSGDVCHFSYKLSKEFVQLKVREATLLTLNGHGANPFDSGIFLFIFWHFSQEFL